MSNFSKYVGSIVLFALLFFCSCSTVQKKPVSVLPENDAEEIIFNLKESQKKYEGLSQFKGLAEAHFIYSQKKFSGYQIVQLQFPQSFYFETLDDFGNTLYKVSTHEDSFRVEDNLLSKNWDQKLSPKNLAKLFPVYWDIPQSLGLLFGKAPLDLLSHSKGTGVSVLQNNIFVVYADNTRFYWDANLKQVTSIEVYRAKKKVFEARFDDFSSNVKKMTLPHKIRLKDYKQGSEMLLQYKEMEF